MAAGTKAKQMLMMFDTSNTTIDKSYTVIMVGPDGIKKQPVLNFKSDKVTLAVIAEFLEDKAQFLMEENQTFIAREAQAILAHIRRMLNRAAAGSMLRYGLEISVKNHLHLLMFPANSTTSMRLNNGIPEDVQSSFLEVLADQFDQFKAEVRPCRGAMADRFWFGLGSNAQSFEAGTCPISLSCPDTHTAVRP
jgi:hypothetical protein